jgi:hypothetical protein
MVKTYICLNHNKNLRKLNYANGGLNTANKAGLEYKFEVNGMISDAEKSATKGISNVCFSAGTNTS